MESGGVALAVGVTATAYHIRQTLFQLSGQDQWRVDDCWNQYLKGRRQIFEAIHQNLVNKNWLDPQVTAIIDSQYILRCRNRWAGEKFRWALQGDWHESRPDIVAWFRITYLRGNKKKLVTYSDSGMASEIHNTLKEEEPVLEAATAELSPENDQATRRSWRETVME